MVWTGDPRQLSKGSFRLPFVPGGAPRTGEVIFQARTDAPAPVVRVVGYARPD